MTATDVPSLSIDALLRPFHEAETPRSKWVIGTEAEKFGVRSDGRAVHFSAAEGTSEPDVSTILMRLSERHGWLPSAAAKDGRVIALSRGKGSITLEPGAQLELSGAPLDTIHQTHLEFAGHRAELQAISEDLDVHWLGLGYHPFARQEDLDWVPKLRYGVMRDYLLTRGARARDMMRRTCTVQANLDYADEQDAIRKLRVGLAATPVVTALFANSPWSEGRRTAERSHRAGVWLDVDPDRTGLLPFLWKDGAGYEDYVEWALDVPMFLFVRNGAAVYNTGQTVRAFMKDGYEGHSPTVEDWDTHLNTLFPEVRLKRTLEMRSTDSQSLSMVSALPALWKGLLYEEKALDAAEALLAPIAYEDADVAQRALPTTAMETTYAGRPMGAWAEELIAVAKDGLKRLANLDADGNDERIYLRPLEDLGGKSPAAVLLEKLPQNDPSAADVIEATRF